MIVMNNVIIYVLYYLYSVVNVGDKDVFLVCYGYNVKVVFSFINSII